MFLQCAIKTRLLVLLKYLFTWSRKKITEWNKKTAKYTNAKLRIVVKVGKITVVCNYTQKGTCSDKKDVMLDKK